MKDTRLVLVLGMHRSGTSCLTGCLEEMGLNLGQVSSQNRFNAKGNKEDKRIFKLNESVLNYSGGSWNSPPKKLHWTKEHIEDQMVILNYYQSLQSPVGIKDPRMLLTFPFWEPVLPKSIQFVGSFRNPESVANSLTARGKNLKVEKNKGYKLWYEYNRKLIKLHKTYDFRLINFDQNPSEYLVTLRQIGKELGLINYNVKLNFFDKKLINQTIQATMSKVKPPFRCRRMYKKLMKLS